MRDSGVDSASLRRMHVATWLFSLIGLCGLVIGGYALFAVAAVSAATCVMLGDFHLRTHVDVPVDTSDEW